MKATRPQVYTAIDGERDYQKQFVPAADFIVHKTIGEEVLLLCEYADRARKLWTDHPDADGECLHQIRKIAAIAVRCMEQHGALERETS